MPVNCRYCSKVLGLLPDDQCFGIYRCNSCTKLNPCFDSESKRPIPFGDYILNEEIGEGANAIVFKGRKSSSNENIALKLFHTETHVDSHSKKEFIREIAFSIELNHPYIIKTIFGDEWDGILYIEMEYFCGLNLAQYLDEYDKMNQLDALEVGIKVAYALDFVWSNYLSIHRDVKPQNVLLDLSGNVKVCDFGMVTAHENAAVDISAVEGTPYYLSPECIMDGSYQDNRSDIYSLGATLYHVITGNPPFDYDSLMDVINARLVEEPPDIGDTIPDSNRDLAMVLKTMMAKDPDDRYVTAFECLEDMIRVKNRQTPVLIDKNRLKVNA